MTTPRPRCASLLRMRTRCWYLTIAFNAGAVAGPLALQRGNFVAIAGRAKLTEWTGQDGAAKHGLSVTADRVLSPYAAGKARKAARDLDEVPA
jgi:hypothetical protein